MPAAFLAVPPRGTLNIHPSLLPRYRGAAPVQRSLEAGDEVTGVTVAYTVQAMDAGPVLAQKRVAVGADETHGPLLQRLFDDGVAMLLAEMPAVRVAAAKSACLLFWIQFFAVLSKPRLTFPSQIGAGWECCGSGGASGRLGGVPRAQGGARGGAVVLERARQNAAQQGA